GGRTAPAGGEQAGERRRRATHADGPGATTPPNAGAPEGNHADGRAAGRAARSARAGRARRGGGAGGGGPGHAG
ncbi:hypothetical protein C3R44_23395, partial [Mycobacterium tuberculosis]